MALETISASDQPDFKLGDWWIRPPRNELERGEEVVHVEARSMAVLVFLAQRAPRVASKQKLLDCVWKDSPHVGEEVISHAIWELRKALGDSARQPTYIQTVPRKGYRLLQEVVCPGGAALPVEGARVARYDLGRELGRGSMGVVFEAADRQLGRSVAIKFLVPELTRDVKACRRFQREARLAASLDHPNLATVHEVGETSGGCHYLVTPLYGGGSLKERLAEGPMAMDQALDFARQLASGLAAAHACGIVHRDIKPANLLIDDHGTLKLADFGIAKLLGGTDLTATGVALGTPAYKSPEQSCGKAVDHRTDIWSAGVVMFEMLTGRRPFDGEYEQAVVHAIVSREPIALKDIHGRTIPTAVRRVVARAMAKEPKERYQRGEELLEALTALTRGSVEAGSGWSWTSRKTRLAFAGMSVVLVLAGLEVWNRFAPQTPPTQSELDQLASADAELRAARHYLEQGNEIWLRGNSPMHLDKAESHFQAALALAPDWLDALGHLAVLRADTYAISRNPAARAGAEGLLKEIEAIDPLFPLLQVGRARLALTAGDLARAEELARMAIDHAPDCGPHGSCDLAYVWLAESLWRQDRDTEAEKILEKGMAVGSGRIRCRLKRAQLHERRGRLDEAIADYREVLNWEPEQTTACNDLGVIYLKMGRHSEALVVLRKAVRITQDPKTHVNIGHALYGEKRWQEALTEYELADRGFGELGVVNPAPAVSIGDVYLELRQPAQAVPWYEKALSTFEQLSSGAMLSVTKQAQYAVVMAKLGRFEEAWELVRVTTLEPGAPSELFVYQARIYALQRDRARLLVSAREAVAAGVSPKRLIDDAAFIEYRDDPEYARAREPPER